MHDRRTFSREGAVGPRNGAPSCRRSPTNPARSPFRGDGAPPRGSPEDRSRARRSSTCRPGPRVRAAGAVGLCILQPNLAPATPISAIGCATSCAGRGEGSWSSRRRGCRRFAEQPRRAARHAPRGSSSKRRWRVRGTDAEEVARGRRAKSRFGTTQAPRGEAGDGVQRLVPKARHDGALHVRDPDDWAAQIARGCSSSRSEKKWATSGAPNRGRSRRRRRGSASSAKRPVNAAGGGRW